MQAQTAQIANAKGDSRQQIIEAAAQCFMLKGLEKATIDDIADVLGATKGRVYHHFRSKNAIYFAVHRQAMQFCFDAIEPLLLLPIPCHEKLEAMATAHARVMMDTLPYQRSIRLGVEIYLRGSTTEAERAVLSELIKQRNDYEDLYRDVLRSGLADGTLDVPSIEIAGRVMMGALNGLVDWYRVRPDQTDADRDQIARTLARTVLHGMVR
ncbi:TetR/AcrR family transcriptional regulator [uncultured Sulfitobacter sp.]|uniref:TetR/AcrR family transcriptional regulator n=1 Tax=uncultured Sulfitobacter sp. TaxID=191468 RepID=UPI0026359188|nr:TetR/AcrR family transcriptional regulator [uncultured Sulfitobacter sp.]